MSKSECFEHDIDVRASWMTQLTEEQLFMLRGNQKTNIGGMLKPARFEVYKAIDELVKTTYLKDITALNLDYTTIHVKGYGTIRQAKDQMSVPLRLASVAFDVIAGLNFAALTKPTPVVTESITV